LTPRGGGPAFDAFVIDMGEGSVRCRLDVNPFQPHEAVDIAIRLDDERVELTGSVLSVRHDRALDHHELIAVYAVNEPTARVIRRYILQWQLAQRRAAAG